MNDDENIDEEKMTSTSHLTYCTRSMGHKHCIKFVPHMYSISHRTDNFSLYQTTDKIIDLHEWVGVIIILVSWLKDGSKENCVYISHVVKVTRQVSLLKLIVRKHMAGN